MCQGSEPLQNTLFAKLSAFFIEQKNTHFLQRLESLTSDCIGPFFSSFLQLFENLNANLTSEKIYVEKECGLKKDRLLKSH